MRRGEISPSAKQTFQGLSRPLAQDDGLLPTELFPLRAEVERANAVRMAALGTPAVKYEARDSGAAPPERRAKLLENMVAPRVLELKADAQVMLVKNVDERLVNGSVGRVLGFYTSAVCAASIGAPAAPAAPQAKKEGASKPRSVSAESKSTNGFVRNVEVGPDGRTPLALCAGENKENKSPASKGKGKVKDDELYPLVEFTTPQGKEIVLVARDEFRSEDSEGKLLARRVQVRAAVPVGRFLTYSDVYRSRWCWHGRCLSTKARDRRSSESKLILDVSLKKVRPPGRSISRRLQADPFP